MRLEDFLSWKRNLHDIAEVRKTDVYESTRTPLLKEEIKTRAHFNNVEMFETKVDEAVIRPNHQFCTEPYCICTFPESWFAERKKREHKYKHVVYRASNGKLYVTTTKISTKEL